MPIRALPATEQEWKSEYDLQKMVFHKIYNTPHTTGQTLDYQQGKVAVQFPDGSVMGFDGTCGLVSCVNILRLAGRDETTEMEVLDYALRNQLCYVGMTSGDCGGTCADDRQTILAHFGVKSRIVPVHHKPTAAMEIAEFVSQGRGVIISVFASVLWGYVDEPEEDDMSLHAITVTSVKKDQDNNILGFYICDSGTDHTDSYAYARFCPLDLMVKMLSGRDMNVTDQIIR